MSHNTQIAQSLALETKQVNAAIRLLDDGNTIPFIARYRKEMTFNLDELQLRNIHEKVHYFRNLDERRDVIIASITDQGHMTEDLENRLLEADTLIELEDLYQPYKPKRVTRASRATKAGLEPLAQQILRQSSRDVKSQTQKFICDDYSTIEEVLGGARDIVAQMIADNSDIRGKIRQKAMEWGTLRCKKVASSTDEKGVFRVYYDFDSRLKWLKAYQILALNRGESEGVLRVFIEISERDWLPIVHSKFRSRKSSPWSKQLELAIQDCAKRLLLPAIERDLRKNLTQTAHQHAIEVFTENVRRLLLQPPLIGHVVMGVDPGFRSGCKVVVVNTTGKVLDTCTIYPNPPQSKYKESLDTLHKIGRKFKVTLITIGNGTASRETEQLVADLVRQMNDLKYLIVNEAGASVYSASDVARQELPDMDVSLRGAVSIARRVQDPLAELVKIDPKSIGVGLYQHDVNQKQLSESLEWVVQSVVNQVGVNLNTCSASLLKHVAGLTQRTAQQIIAYRDYHGKFVNREDLFKVKGFGIKTFEQCAGFLRISDGNNWLDNSAIHPESYAITQDILELAHIVEDSDFEKRRDKIIAFMHTVNSQELANRLNIGLPTVEDILEQIQRPGRDPRENIPRPMLRQDILKIEDLKTDMRLNGTVRNVVDFGAFIDIGVKQDGLLHSSKIPPKLNLGIGDVIEVVILTIDKERGRIGLGVI